MKNRARGTQRGALMSTRERGTLVLLAQGYNARQIADRLNVSVNYVYSLLRLLKARFAARTAAEIVLKAVGEGIISAEGRLLDVEGGEHGDTAHRR